MMVTPRKDGTKLQVAAWTTESEIKFLQNLGKGKHPKRNRPSRDKLLEGYAMSIVRDDGFGRVNWGSIDQGAVRQYLVEELAK